jgi:hypothetical protein
VPAPPQGSRRTLLSDVEGRITHVALAFPTYQTAGVPRLRECLAGVLTALGPDVRRSVLHHAGDEALIRTLPHPDQLDPVVWNRPRTVQIPAGSYHIEDGVLRIGRLPWSDFTPWVQDCFLVAQDAGGPRLLASPSVVRPGGGADTDVTPIVARHLGWPCDPSPVVFEAANVLVDAGAVVVARDTGAELPSRTVASTLRRAFAPGRGARRLLRLPPRGRQPFAHQDMYVALAGPHGRTGQPVAVVASMRLAARITGGRAGADRSERSLDRVARTLEAAGYHVARAPRATIRLERDWPESIVTYTNALVEGWRDVDGRPRRRVTFARFGSDGGPAAVDLDEAAAEIWASLGFAVRLADGPFTWLGIFNGSVRCLTKVLART